MEKKNDGCRRYCLRIPNEHFERFQRLYSGCLPQFLIRCVIRAYRSSDFFEDVFFGIRKGD